jgi:hypothetical protein
MRPQQMESLTSEVQAYRAALATLLDLDLDDVPAYDGQAQGIQWDAWLASMNLGAFRFMPDQGAMGVAYGLGRIVSPYVGYDMHTVVLQGGMVVFDPHPDPEEFDLDERLGLVELMIPLDPALPSGRFVVDSDG